MKYSATDQDFISRMKQAAEESNIGPEEEYVFRIVALYVEFKLETIEKDLWNIYNSNLNEKIKAALLDSSVYKAEKNVFSLNDRIRTQVLSRMSVEEIRSILSQIVPGERDWRQNLYERLLKNELTSLDQLKPEEYVQAYIFFRWIKHPNIKLPSEERLSQLIRTRDLKTPLQKLTKSFSGRTNELKQLREFVYTHGKKSEMTGPPNLFISGVGGVGKSTLVSKFILDELNENTNTPPIYIRIDFDNPGYGVDDIFSLIKEGLAQVKLQNPQYEDRFSELIDRIDQDSNYESYGKNTSRGSERLFFYNEYLMDSDRIKLSSLQRPVLIVFDSFEELQFRASKAEIDSLFQLMDEISSIIPMMRAIFIGRSELNEYNVSAKEIVITELDRPGAESLLHAHGINDPLLRSNIFDRFGGNPLTLQLAANLVIKEFGSAVITNQEVERREIFDKIDKHLIQQQLVARNLDHLHNKDLAVIAVPGMILRKINAQIIKNVLAIPCGLGEIDDQRATDLFEELKKEKFLLKQSGSDVEFRKDLRVSLYDLILKEPKYKAFKVHDAAVAYYEGRQDPADRAEYLFHRLKRGDDVSIIDEIYRPDIKSFLETGLSELPDEARSRLSLKMELNVAIDYEKVPIAKWELFLMAQIRNVLEHGDEKQLIDLSKKFSSRGERTGDPEFEYLERLVKLRLVSTGSKSSKAVIAEVFDLINNPRSAKKTHLLQGFAFELKEEFNAAFYLLDNASIGLDKLSPTVENISCLIEYYFTMMRVSIRSNGKFELTSLNELKKIIEDKFRDCPDSALMNFSDLFLLFPKQYIIPVREIYMQRFPGVDFNAKSSLDPDSNRYINMQALSFCLDEVSRQSIYMNSSEFHENYKFLKENIKSNSELERYVRRIYKVYSKDISLPGSLDVCLYDFLLFAEMMPRENNKLELNKIFVVSDFSGVRNTITTEAFINSSEVKACIDRLDKAFLKSGKSNLVVSDILDEQGNQYVNLIQRSNGVHHFALLGYTYILEKMGIRFLKVAGTNMAAVNAAVFGISGETNDTKTEKALDHFSGLDYFSLVDGSRIVKWMVRSFGKSKDTVRQLLTFIRDGLVIVSALVLTFSLAAILKQLEIPYYERSFLPLLIATGVIFLLVIIFFAALWKSGKKFLRFGGGLNPGNYFHSWLKGLFRMQNINDLKSFEEKVSRTPMLKVREGTHFNKELLRAGTSFISVEVVTQNRIVFPEMAELFWNKEQLKSVDPATFVRASASTPLFFDSVLIKDIPVNDQDLINAWADTFQEFEVPHSACLVDGAVLPTFPIDVFKMPGIPDAPMPTFGVETISSSGKVDTTNVKDLSWVKYAQRLVNRTEYSKNVDELSQMRSMERGMCYIKIDSISLLNFYLADNEKLELFLQGAKAATEFLLKFNWETYKNSLSLQTTLRV
jgi:NTE family protein